jgi:hypothetical protein
MQGIADVPESVLGGRMICLCDDCQAYAHYLGHAEDVLDENGGTEILPIAPAHLKITEGADQLRCCRLSAKGMYRWYAGCCATPIANTMPSATSPYAGLVHTFWDADGVSESVEKIVGPVAARVQGKFGIGKLPAGTLNTVSVKIVWRVVLFILKSKFRQLHKPSPFFNSQTGKPTADAYVLTDAERGSLAPLCGPKS